LLVAKSPRTWAFSFLYEFKLGRRPGASPVLKGWHKLKLILDWNMNVWMKGVLGLSIIFLAGCSTPETRINENRASFDALPTKQQIAVQNGEITEGMSRDAVYLALGKPDRVVKGVEGNRTREYWVYTRLEPTMYHGFGMGVGSFPRHYGYSWDYGPSYDYQEVPIAEISFEGDRVVGWRKVEEMSS
jgi:hypothetical protein